MEIEEKIELNKKIRKYSGDNSFVLSLQKQLKISKTIQKVQVGDTQLLLHEFYDQYFN